MQHYCIFHSCCFCIHHLRAQIKAVDSSTHIRTTADAFLEYYLSHINDIQNGANAAADRVGDIEDLDCEDDED
jgi:hypothetical protein